MPDRCVVCGLSLAEMRAHARYCGPPCRAEASRLRRILSCEGANGYRTLGERLEASRKRTREGSGRAKR
jgi:hypothetical protein